MHLLGVSWSSGVARLRVRSGGGDASRLVQLTGARLRYLVVERGRRICLGHTDRSSDAVTHVDCGNAPDVGRQCERCRSVDNVLAASMHQSHKLGRGAVDGRLASHLDQPHRLYLAAFRDGSLKVGTSAGASGGHRLVEQGAWLARYVALATNGFAVREIEDLVTETLGVQQAVTVHRKLAGLVSPRPDEHIFADLAGLSAKVGQLVGLMADPRIESIDEPWEHPGVSTALWRRVVRYPTTIDTGSHDLTVAGAIGRVAAVRRPGFDETFVVDVGPLFGVEIDIGDHQADEVALQASLF